MNLKIHYLLCTYRNFRSINTFNGTARIRGSKKTNFCFFVIKQSFYTLRIEGYQIMKSYC